MLIEPKIVLGSLNIYNVTAGVKFHGPKIETKSLDCNLIKVNNGEKELRAYLTYSMFNLKY